MFGLELHPDKTRRIEFGRFAEENRRRREVGARTDLFPKELPNGPPQIVVPYAGTTCCNGPGLYCFVLSARFHTFYSNRGPVTPLTPSLPI
jgi:hypothetical protein